MEQVRTSMSARRIASEPRSMVIHAEATWLNRSGTTSSTFFTKLMKHATVKGINTRITAAEGARQSCCWIRITSTSWSATAPAMAATACTRCRPISGASGISTRSACTGIRRCASPASAPDQVDADKAEYFFNGVTGYMLRENVSKFPQEVRMKIPLQPAAAVIYCQEIEGYLNRSHYLTTEQMIRTNGARPAATNASMSNRIPSSRKPTRKAIMDIVADYQNVTVSDASIHDLIEASRCVVTQNSAAGFEALMQRRCVITCGKSDYWHATLTPKRESDLREALKYGPEAMADFAYPKYLYWFLDRNCLEPAKDDFVKRAWARIRDKAFL